MGADGDPSVADVPEGELSDEAMALERNGTMDNSDAEGGVMVVANSDNTDDEETVCDKSPEAGNAAEPEKATDNTAEARTGRMNGPGAMADNTADAAMADGTAVVMAGNTKTPDTTELGQDEAAAVALAYKSAHRRAGMIDIHVQSRDSRPRRNQCRLRVSWGHPLPDHEPQPQRECPPVDGTQPPRRHPPRPAEHQTAYLWTHSHPSSGYQGAASEPVFRERVHCAVGLSDPSLVSQSGAHHPAVGRL
ncbi:hypothetical protein PIB30_050714 [Stylosanthes scabra]|uniref:Uncharacterized protein n=1 Tax=Stylosanthes scabra TaxID=79078 RepID=A0ABU6VIJ9_9FABA|nr:hypothetical protein [Stylosanthes scabra]